jgi:hypothetical protein
MVSARSSILTSRGTKTDIAHREAARVCDDALLAVTGIDVRGGLNRCDFEGELLLPERGAASGEDRGEAANGAAPTRSRHADILHCKQRRTRDQPRLDDFASRRAPEAGWLAASVALGALLLGRSRLAGGTDLATNPCSFPDNG